MRALALGVALLAGAVAVAVTAMPAVASPTAEAEKRVTRMVKAAEREGFEQHELERSLAIFAPAARIVHGRREVADAHDIVLDVAALKAMRAQRYRTPPTGREQMFFRDITTEVDGATMTLTATVSRTLFNGRDEFRHQYRLKQVGDGWTVTTLRRWPLMEQFNGPPRILDDAAWLDAEERVEAALKDEGGGIDRQLFALIQAGFFKQAYDVARARTEAEPGDVDAWRGRAMLAFDLGEVADALAAAEKALAISPQIGLPPHLMPQKKGKKTGR